MCFVEFKCMGESSENKCHTCKLKTAFSKDQGQVEVGDVLSDLKFTLFTYLKKKEQVRIFFQLHLFLQKEMACFSYIFFFHFCIDRSYLLVSQLSLRIICQKSLLLDCLPQELGNFRLPSCASIQYTFISLLFGFQFVISVIVLWP